jgi:predicted RNA-binding Zn-ribbon protein involved in translation (DUF1610 family)
MICPSKICRQEIPEDSLYCDQCGTKILRCSKCGNPGTSPRCGKCGGAMVFKETDLPRNAPDTADETPAPNTTHQAAPTQRPAETPAAPPPPQPAASQATVVFQAETKKLFFHHSNGWSMELKDGDILGRTAGSHTDRLGSFPVISGTHAGITCENGAWHITDQKSTNKTYVGGALAPPGVPVPLKNNDVVQLANVTFIVREA